MGASEIRVLVVDDAPEYTELVTAVMRRAGYEVRAAATGAAALEAVGAFAPDLIVLDLTLPDADGIDLCRTIRDRSNAYVLMLTTRDHEVDKVLGFKMGADDYVTKPFSPRELGARVEALLRRPRAPQTERRTERTLGPLQIRPESREVLVDGEPVVLTRIEFDLLDALSSNPKVVLSRQVLLDRVWGEDWYGDDHVVDVHMGNLRKKIDRGRGPSLVRTVRGVGYAMAPPLSPPGPAGLTGPPA